MKNLVKFFVDMVVILVVIVVGSLVVATVVDAVTSDDEDLAIQYTAKAGYDLNKVTIKNVVVKDDQLEWIIWTSPVTYKKVGAPHSHLAYAVTDCVDWCQEIAVKTMNGELNISDFIQL